MDLLYDIQHLECTYNGTEPVLLIDDIQIKKNRLYFLVGASGIGKSTFIETLGLMNSTIGASSDPVIFSGQNGSISLQEIWQQGEEKLSQFRKDSFSFIFQNTNLMPHYTSGENMVLTALLDGMSYDDALSLVKEKMAQVNLDPEIFDKNIQNVSGGQRQRLAFVRAFITNYQVLFGDEPTGNLDPLTAKSLIRMLKEEIKNANKTCIIVSHDIDLALEFGDEILWFEQKKKQDAKFGYLCKDQTLVNTDDAWLLAGNTIDNPAAFLESKFIVE